MAPLKLKLSTVAVFSLVLSWGLVGCANTSASGSDQTAAAEAQIATAEAQQPTLQTYVTPAQTLQLQSQKIKGVEVKYFAPTFDEFLAKSSDLSRYINNIGLCLLDEQGQMIFGVHEDQDFAIMSTYKFAVGYALAKYATVHQLSLDQSLQLDSNTLSRHEQNYSPLRDKLLQSAEGQSTYNTRFEVSLGTLLDYAVKSSDSMASDLLAEFMGGWDSVNQLLGTDFMHYELEFTVNPELSYQNHQTPMEATQLMRAFALDNSIDPAFKQKILNAMHFTPTGTNRIQAGVKAALGDGVADVYNKTGTGYYINGKRVAVNDLAMIEMDGKTYYLAVFYKDVAQAKNYEGVEKHMQKVVAKIFAYLK